MRRGERERRAGGPPSDGGEYRGLFVRMRDGCFKADMEGRIVEANPAFAEMLGHTAEELSGMNVVDLFPRERHEAERRVLEEQVRRRGHSDIHRTELVRKDGVPVPAEVSTYLSTLPDGMPDGMWTFARELVEPREAAEGGGAMGFERLVTTISSDFIDVPPEETNAEISHALRLIGEFAGVDRAYVFLFSPDGAAMSNTHEWCAAGIMSHIHELRDVPVEAFGWSVGRMRGLEPVNFDDISDMPPEAGAERREFEREGIRSILFVPISQRGAALGFIGFDAVRARKRWSDGDVSVLRVVGDIFANALGRMRSAAELRREHLMRQIIVDTSPAGILVADPDGNIAFANPAAERVLGLSAGDITSRTYNDPGWRITAHDGSEFREEDLPFHRVRSTKKGVRDVRHAIEWPDGRRVLLSINAEPLLATDGSFQGMLATVDDVTESVAAVRELTESEAKFRAAVETSVDNIFLVDPADGRLLEWDRRLSALLGYSHAELSSMTVYDFIDHPRGDVDARIAEALAAGCLRVGERRYRRKDGSIVNVDVNVSAVPAEGRQVLCVASRDISSESMARAELAASEEKFRTLVERAVDGIAIIQSGKLMYVSGGAVRLIGHQADDLVGRPFTDFVAPEHAALLLDRYRRRMAGEDVPAIYTTEMMHADGRRVPVEISAGVIEHGGAPADLILVRDITPRIEAERSLRESEERFGNIVESIPLGMHIYELSPEGELVFAGANPAADRILRVDNSRFIGMTVEEAFPSLAGSGIPDAYRRAASEGIPYDAEQVDYDAGGISGAFEVHAFQTSPGRIVATFRDITRRLRAERAVRETEERYRSLFEESMDIIFESTVDGRIVRMNPTGLERFGLQPADLERVNARDLYVDPADRERFREAMERDGSTRDFETQYRSTTGSVIDCMISATAIFDEKGVMTGYQGITHDITSRKRAEEALRESEARFRTFFENVPVYCYMIAPDGTILDINKAALGALGYAKRDIVGRNVRMIYSPECEEKARNVFDRWRSTGRIEGEEMEIVSRDGGKRTVILSAESVRDQHGRILHSISVQKDITEMKRAEEAVRGSLGEKEVLLKEIHHRVKNNMQVISSLMSLQAGYIADREMLSIFRESQDRVRSMALIHDKLYQSMDLANIDFFEYAQSLCYHLFQTYGVDPARIRLDLRGDELPMGVDRGVPCGLIVNELVSNCLKHAFPDGRSGTVTVDVSEERGRARIIVADDGIGFPPEIDFRSTESLGLELVTTLAAQIDGTIELDASAGTRFTIEFENAKGGGTHGG